MKKFVVFVLVFVTVLSAFGQLSSKKYARVYKRTEKHLKKELKKNPFWDSKVISEASPQEWWIQQFMATMNPVLKRPTPEMLFAYLENNPNAGSNASVLPGTTANPWVERGPNNVGGRTRALAWDPFISNKVWAGAVTGGLWYNDDITSSSSSWVHVSGLWANLNITCIAFDPNNGGIMYVGTGEGFGSTASSSVGAGIWKSTDTGKTWNRLTSTSSYLIINDIKVRNESGTSVVYAAVDANYANNSWHGLSSFGIKRSVNGGTSWTTVGVTINGQTTVANNIEIGPDNRLWVGTRKCPYSVTDKGGSNILYSDNGTSWTIAYSSSNRTVGRVAVAVAPSDKNYIYALFEDGNKLDSALRSTNGGVSWTAMTEPSDADNGIPNTDFTRGQAWYDLVIAVDPNNKNTIIAGGVDLFRSTDGGATWTQISKWSNNNNLSNLSCPLVHADQHAIKFKSGSSSIALFGNDGGVYYSSNLTNAASSSSAIVERVKNYITFQCYWGDIASAASSNNMIAGAQDNGTEKFTSAGLNSTSSVTGGDGAYCFIDATNNNKQIASYVYNQYYYTTNNWSSSSNLINDGATGSFINAAEWDNNQLGLITNKGSGGLYRRLLTGSTPGTLETVSYGGAANATAITAVKLSNGKTRVWVGDNQGKVWLCNDFWVSNPSFTDKTGTINAGTISNIHNPNGSDTVLVTISNYGLKNIYLSTNAGTSYTAKDGNLADMPVWAILVNPNKINEVVIGTELGVFACSDFFSATNPTWAAYTEGMGNVKIATLRLRASDLTIMAATHGRGVFTSNAFKSATPSVDFSANKVQACANDIITLSDASLNDPTSWLWAITPSTGVSYTSGTTAASQNPNVILKAGTYTVKLTASNGAGSANKTKTAYITVTDTFTPKMSVVAPSTSLCQGQTFVLSPTYSNISSGDIIKTYSAANAVATVFTGASVTLSAQKNTSYKLIATTNKACSLLDSFYSNAITPTVLDITNLSATIANKPLSLCQGIPLNLSASVTGASTADIEWYVNGVNKAKSATYTHSNAVNNDEIVIGITKTGPCVVPANTVYDTAKVNVKTRPITPVITLSWDTLYASNAGSNTVNWYLNGAFHKTGAPLKLTSNGRYNAVYYDGSCYSDSSNVIIFNSLNANKLSKIGVELFPNPANDFVQITSASKVSTVQVLAFNGQLIQQYAPLAHQFKLTLPTLAKGNYLIRIQLQNGQTQTSNLFVEQK